MKLLMYPATNYQLVFNSKENNSIVAAKVVENTNDRTFISLSITPETSLTLATRPYYTLTYTAK